jgi:hypothetical protein
MGQKCISKFESYSTSQSRLDIITVPPLRASSTYTISSQPVHFMRFSPYFICSVTAYPNSLSRHLCLQLQQIILVQTQRPFLNHQSHNLVKNILIEHQLIFPSEIYSTYRSSHCRQLSVGIISRRNLDNVGGN